MLNLESCWTAVESRDAGADGSFYYGVKTTGVYCRPGCASRRPLRANTVFFATIAEAQKSGMFIFIDTDLKFDLPRAETPSHHITMGFDEDLDDAAKTALRQMIGLIGERLGLAPEDAYMFCSLAVDMRVTQLVDGNKGIHAMLPKRYAATRN